MSFENNRRYEQDFCAIYDYKLAEIFLSSSNIADCGCTCGSLWTRLCDNVNL